MVRRRRRWAHPTVRSTRPRDLSSHGTPNGAHHSTGPSTSSYRLPQATGPKPLTEHSPLANSAWPTHTTTMARMAKRSLRINVQRFRPPSSKSLNCNELPNETKLEKTFLKHRGHRGHRARDRWQQNSVPSVFLKAALAQVARCWAGSTTPSTDRGTKLGRANAYYAVVCISRKKRWLVCCPIPVHLSTFS